jgi:hypothetical protein
MALHETRFTDWASALGTEHKVIFTTSQVFRVSGAIKGSHLRRVKQEPWTLQSVSRDTSTATV